MIGKGAAVGGGVAAVGSPAAAPRLASRPAVVPRPVAPLRPAAAPLRSVAPRPVAAPRPAAAPPRPIPRRRWRRGRMRAAGTVNIRVLPATAVPVPVGADGGPGLASAPTVVGDALGAPGGTAVLPHATYGAGGDDAAGAGAVWDSAAGGPFPAPWAAAATAPACPSDVAQGGAHGAADAGLAAAVALVAVTGLLAAADDACAPPPVAAADEAGAPHTSLYGHHPNQTYYQMQNLRPVRPHAELTSLSYVQPAEISNLE